MTILTPEEEKQFTIGNAVAFDLCLVEGRETNTRPPCWLCMSEETKETFRQKAVDFINKHVAIVPITKDRLDGYCHRNFPDLITKVNLWRESELHLKQLREEHNPAAYFYPIT